MKRYELRSEFDCRAMRFFVHGDGSVTTEYLVGGKEQKTWSLGYYDIDIEGRFMSPYTKFDKEDARKIWNLLRSIGYKPCPYTSCDQTTC
jgi:hypothetical protein